jgi:alpha-beta hydrolase superfamily lysophospholipase
VLAAGTLLAISSANTQLIRRSRQYGGMRLDFEFAGRPAFLVQPPREPLDNSKPWVFFAPTLLGQQPDERHDWLFSRLVDQGFAIAGIDVGGPSGAPRATESFSAFRDMLVSKYRLSQKPCLLAADWGALFLYEWASQHANEVRCIAGIRPLVNVESDPRVASELARAYDLSTAEFHQRIAQHNPIDQLGALADHSVPILHLHGAGDTVVPEEPNSGEMARRYRALGGTIEVVSLTGEGPEVWRSPTLLDFFVSRGLAAAD